MTDDAIDRMGLWERPLGERDRLNLHVSGHDGDGTSGRTGNAPGVQSAVSLMLSCETNPLRFTLRSMRKTKEVVVAKRLSLLCALRLGGVDGDDARGDGREVLGLLAIGAKMRIQSIHRRTHACTGECSLGRATCSWSCESCRVREKSSSSSRCSAQLLFSLSARRKLLLR